jgi:hypothetical protein
MYMNEYINVNMYIFTYMHICIHLLYIFTYMYLFIGIKALDYGTGKERGERK